MASVTGAGERGRPSSARGEAPRRPRPRHTGRWVLRSNIFTFYIRSRMILEPDLLRVVMHRTLLGLVPVGTTIREIPLENLRSIVIRVVVRPVRLAVAAGLAVMALLVPMPLPARVAVVFLAFVLVFLGVAFGIRVQSREGAGFVIPICVAQRGVAGAAVRQIERSLQVRRSP